MLNDFKALKISLASPQQIMSWSHGEVKKAETINYRTHKAEVDGLMDEKIFGPTKNYECYCGKYKKIRYKGIICDKCGVEVTHKRVRRERIGHIKLAAPVTHVWYAYGVPNKMALVLDIPQKKLESVIYFSRYMVNSFSDEGRKQALEAVKQNADVALNEVQSEIDGKINEIKEKFDKDRKELKKTAKSEKSLEMQKQRLDNNEKKEVAKVKSIYDQRQKTLQSKFERQQNLIESLSEGMILSEEEYAELSELGIDFFEAGMGAEAIQKLLNKIDPVTEVEIVKTEMESTKSQLKQRRLVQRLRVLEGMKKNNIKPEWMIVHFLPVLPPDLRPIIQLPGGRFATSDLNDLYRRVINRNNRLQRLVDLGAPEIILRNEKRMLQEAVDALIDNSHRPGNPVLNSRQQPYKSLSDMLRGKQGRFRQNLLGKRVDFSGRSVIIGGPELSVNQCGLPKTMALELFKPFVMHEIIAQGLAANIKSAKNVFEEKSDAVWDILEKVIKNRPVLLNRAPTLHKQGIQAFFPVLIEGNAIKLHPLVCTGFNADFDGDQMAVHVPLSEKAVAEAIKRMFPGSNILLMADGKPVINTMKDMAFGVYYLTGIDEAYRKEHPQTFADTDEVLGTYNIRIIDLREPIKVLMDGKLTDTTAGRIIFNHTLPADFSFVNEQLNKKSVAKISATILEKYGNEEAIKFLDQIEQIGFKYATRSAFSISMEDFIVSRGNTALLEEVSQKEQNLINYFEEGMVSVEERKKLFEEMWIDLVDRVSKTTWNEYLELNNNLVKLNDSGAVPVENPLRQISGVRGLIIDPSGNIVELPLRSNYKEGLSSLEYFVAARGTRKALADVALKTAESGYLTRKLVDVAQDVITRIDDCGTEEGVDLIRTDQRRIEFLDRIIGRWSAASIVGKNGKEYVPASTEITSEIAAQIAADESISSVKVRSVLTCEADKGVCAKCYGYDLGTKKEVNKGIAVGVIAAQAMGEASTQLTLHAKHRAGSATVADITQGLPRVDELFEARTPKGKSILAEIAGIVEVTKDEAENSAKVIISSKEERKKIYDTVGAKSINLKSKKQVKEGSVLFINQSEEEVTAEFEGQAVVSDGKITLTGTIEQEVEYDITSWNQLLVKDGDEVVKGQQITSGSIDPKELMKLRSLQAAQKYIIDNIQETYGIQGIGIDDKHVEVAVKQMSRFVMITSPGDSEHLAGDFIDNITYRQINKDLEGSDKKPIKAVRQLMGLSNASLRTESFLSAASFQDQVRVLTEASILGKLDPLNGLKENVIIGRPVPLAEELR